MNDMSQAAQPCFGLQRRSAALRTARTSGARAAAMKWSLKRMAPWSLGRSLPWFLNVFDEFSSLFDLFFMSFEVVLTSRYAKVWTELLAASLLLTCS